MVRVVHDETWRKPQWLIVAEYIYDHAPTKQVDIATALNINAGNLSKAIKYLRDDRKMIDPKSLRLTPSGRAYIDEVRSNRSANDDAN